MQAAINTVGRFSCSCGREWDGLGQAHCAGCHLHFSSAASFDKHRLGFRCLSHEELTAPHETTGKPRMQYRDTARGRIWVTRLREPVVEAE